MNIYTCIKVTLVSIVDGDPKALLHQGLGEDVTPFPGLLHFTLDPHLIVVREKQEGIKSNFLSFWYELTWGWTPVTRGIKQKL